MGSCMLKSGKDVREVEKINKHNQSIDMEKSLEKGKNGTIKKKMSVNYKQIPNKIHRQETEFQQGESSRGKPYGLAGLENLGNTCFINSALQCLSNVPPLCDYFLSSLQEKEINLNSFLGSKGQITKSFADLMVQMWSTDEAYLSPRDFLQKVAMFGPQFADGMQHDSHEFLAFLVDILHEDLNRVKDRPYIEGKDYNGGQFEVYAKESWKEYLTRNRSIIVDLFQGQTKSTVTCLNCPTVSHKFETFMYLSIPIPETKKKTHRHHKHSQDIEEDDESFSLSQCIQEFTKQENLEQGELWFCPKCKKLRESTKKIDLWKLPNILIIHLKRFKFTKNKRCKLTNFVDFPIKDFDLSSLTSGKQRDKPIYDLFAICNHGGTLTQGHYTTFAKNRSNQNWYYFNDNSVELVDNPEEKIKTSQAYVLFYSKTSVEEFYRQTLSSPESWPHFLEEEAKQAEKPTPGSVKRIQKQHTYTFNTIFEKKPSKYGFVSQQPPPNGGNYNNNDQVITYQSEQQQQNPRYQQQNSNIANGQVLQQLQLQQQQPQNGQQFNRISNKPSLSPFEGMENSYTNNYNGYNDSNNNGGQKNSQGKNRNDGYNNSGSNNNISNSSDLNQQKMKLVPKSRDQSSHANPINFDLMDAVQEEDLQGNLQNSPIANIRYNDRTSYQNQSGNNNNKLQQQPSVIKITNIKKDTYQDNQIESHPALDSDFDRSRGYQQQYFSQANPQQYPRNITYQEQQLNNDRNGSNNNEYYQQPKQQQQIFKNNNTIFKQTSPSQNFDFKIIKKSNNYN